MCVCMYVCVCGGGRHAANFLQAYVWLYCNYICSHNTYLSKMFLCTFVCTKCAKGVKERLWKEANLLCVWTTPTIRTLYTSSSFYWSDVVTRSPTLQEPLIFLCICGGSGDKTKLLILSLIFLFFQLPPGMAVKPYVWERTQSR